MNRRNQQFGLETAAFDASSATAVKLINVGTDANPRYVLGYGTAAPAAGLSGWEAGAVFFATGSTSTRGMYVNKGTGSSSNFARPIGATAV